MKSQALYLLIWPILLLQAAYAGEPAAQEGESDPVVSLEAASKAASAAVEAANAAAAAANNAASAASAAAQVANQAMKAAADGIDRQKAIRAAAETAVMNERNAMNSAPLNLKLDESLFNPQSQSLAEVNNLSLPRLFGMEMLPVSVTRQIHNEYLNVGEGGAPVAEVPASVINALDVRESTIAAVEFSRDVRIANERVNQANSQSNQARALLLPNLSVRYGRGREISSPSSVIDPDTGNPVRESTHIRTDSVVTLRQPLVDLPSIYDWQRRKQVIQSREESKRGSQGDAWLSTVSAYLGLTSSRLIADLSLNYEGKLNQLFEYVNKRAEAGASSSADRERVRARTLAASASRTQQESSHAAAGVEFIRLTNLAPEQIKLPAREDFAAIPETVGEAIRMAMANSPDVASLRAELRAAEIDQNTATAKFAPRLDVELSRFRTNNAGGPVGMQDDTRMMLVMNWNLINGGGDVQLGKEKQSRLDEARYRLDDLQRRMTQSMISQYAALDATREQLLSAYRELNAISTAANAMSEKMFAGNQSLLDLLDVYERQYQARVRAVSLHVQELDTLSQIDRLLGRSNAMSVAKNSVTAPGVATPQNSVPAANVEVKPLPTPTEQPGMPLPAETPK